MSVCVSVCQCVYVSVSVSCRGGGGGGGKPCKYREKRVERLILFGCWTVDNVEKATSMRIPAGPGPPPRHWIGFRRLSIPASNWGPFHFCQSCRYLCHHRLHRLSVSSNFHLINTQKYSKFHSYSVVKYAVSFHHLSASILSST